MAQRQRLKTPVNAFGTVDPAPASPVTDVGELRIGLLDERRPMFERFQAVFALRNADSDAAALALCQGLLRSESVLLRHECAYVLGQLRRTVAIPALAQTLRSDASPMVRHESAEALGAIGTDEVLPSLQEGLTADASLEVRESCEVALAHIAYLRDPHRL